MKTKTSKSKSLLLIIIINLCVIFVVVVVLAKSDHDHHHHHHHHDDHQHGHKLNKAKKIYNGRRASQEEAKFMAVILEPSIGAVDLICSAVIITHDTLLTAAHCFDNKSYPDIRRMEIWPGAVQINSAYYQMNRDLIKTIHFHWVHPEYDSKLGTYDLAIIKVGPRPWQSHDDRVKVAQMPVMILRHWLPLKAYGYGYEHGNRPVLTGNLNVIEYTRIYSQTYCERMLGFRYNAPDILFATKEVSHHYQLHISSGQARGDSGGGIFLHGTVRRLDTSTNRWIQLYTEILVGIHSGERTRNETMRQRKYFFHTNITTFLPWIKRFTNARFETYTFSEPLL